MAHIGTRGSINCKIYEIFVNSYSQSGTNANTIVLAYLKGYHNTFDDVSMTFSSCLNGVFDNFMKAFR